MAVFVSRSNAQHSLKSPGMLVRFDHVTSGIAHGNHDRMRTAVVQRVSDCIADGIRFGVPQTTEWQRIGNQINRRDDLCAREPLNVRSVPVMGRLWDCDDLGQGVISVLT